MQEAIRVAYFAGYPISVSTKQQAVRRVLQSAIDKDSVSYRFVNAGTLDAAAQSGEYRSLLRDSGVSFPDGAPLAAVIRMSIDDKDSCEQVRGPWLFEQALDQGRQLGLRHFFLGTTPQTLAKLVDEVAKRWPGTVIAGTVAPEFRNLTRSEIVEQDTLIRSCSPDLIWVALGTPKQDREAHRLAQSTGVTTLAVGAAFDFTAGTKQVAPKLLTQLHLEWLFRLVLEPRRLWRRYLIGNARFIFLTVRDFVDRRHTS